MKDLLEDFAKVVGYSGEFCDHMDSRGWYSTDRRIEMMVDYSRNGTMWMQSKKFLKDAMDFTGKYWNAFLDAMKTEERTPMDTLTQMREIYEGINKKPWWWKSAPLRYGATRDKRL